MQYGTGTHNRHNSNAGHGGSAIDHGKGLLRIKDIRGYAGFFERQTSAHAPALIKSLPLTCHACSHIGHGREVTRCSNRSLSRHHGRNTLIEHIGQLLQQRHGYSRITRCQAEHAAQHGSTGLFNAYGLARTAAVKRQRVCGGAQGSIFGQPFAAGFAEARIHAVNCITPFERPLQKNLRTRHASPKQFLCAERYVCAALCNELNLLA